MVDIKKLQRIEEKSKTRKTVTRKYTTKKGVKTKQYTYAQSELLFRKTKKGYKVIDKNWKDFEDRIRKEFPEEQADALIANARRIRGDIESGKAVYTSERQKGKNRIDVRSFVARLSTGVVNKFFANMGITPEEIVQYVKDKTAVRDKDGNIIKEGKEIIMAELMNPGNWKNDEVEVPLTEGGRIKLRIEFNYDGVSGIQILGE